MNNFIAHRGNNGDSCENELSCLKEVLNYDYVSGVEIDIRQTKDKKLILSHNSFLRKDINFYFISKYNLYQLKKKTFILKGKKYKISTLKEFLSNLKTTKMILIDIKDKIDIKDLYKLLKKYHHLNIYVCSFHYDLMYLLKKRYPKLKVGIIIGYTMNEKKNIDIFDFISIHYNYNNKYLKEHFIWTVNHPLIFKNLDNNLGIITDNSYLLNKNLSSNFK